MTLKRSLRCAMLVAGTLFSPAMRAQTTAPLTAAAQTTETHTGSGRTSLTAAVAQPPAPRFTYDNIAPDQDATSRTLEEATAITSDTERVAWLATAAVTENYRETQSSQFHNYHGLVPGDETEEKPDGKKFVSIADSYGGDVSRQPAGPLTGHVVYCSAGHGWTNDNTSTSLWYTQRPPTHGVLEDMGNLDQMNLYADLCFRAGATIVPLRPLGFQHIERVIDNESGHAAFHGAWADSQSTVSFGYDGARVPYRFAAAAVKESAVARFTPVIPVQDVYPVYCWARAGADRITQTYRIIHTGGVTEVDVDHRRVGNGWVYLGSYLFKAGTQGFVEVTNQARDAASVAAGGIVVADAIRFGNGMGDVNRGGGISTRPREEEASRYWTERALSKAYPPIYDAFAGRDDQSNNVGAAPRLAAHMNRESEGGYFDRVFVSFHSNASGGRGVVGLFNSHAQLRPDHQIELAKLTADELNAEMTSSGRTIDRPWFVRKTRTDAHINFGEIRRDYLNNEMAATIVEVAFHDNPDDAALLRQLSIRRAIAQSAYRATLRYFSVVGSKNFPIYSPPSAPVLVSARQGFTSGTVDLQWLPSAEDPLSSQTGSIHYRIYRSPDGYSFDRGQDVGTVTKYSFNKIRELEPGYFKVTAVSQGGESLPSGVLGVSRSAGPRVLVVQGASTIDDDMVLWRTEPASLGSALGSGGSFVRLVPRLMNNSEQIRVIGDGADRLNYGFDSMSINSFMTSVGQQQPYAALAVMLGRNPIAGDMATSEILTSLHDYVTSGGRLFIDGACLAECGDSTTESLGRWGEFATTVLQVGFDPLTSATKIIKSGERNLTTVTLQIGNRQLRYFDPRPTEALSPLQNGRTVLAYEGVPEAAAVATLLDRHIRTIVVGFPIEELESRQEQGVLVAQILLAMGLELQPAKKKVAEAAHPAPTGAKPEAKVAVADVSTSGTP